MVRGQGVKGQTMAIRTVPVLAMRARAVDGVVKNGGGGNQEWWRGKSRMVEVSLPPSVGNDSWHLVAAFGVSLPLAFHCPHRWVMISGVVEVWLRCS